MYIIGLCWVLGMLSFHGEEFQVLAGKVVVGREEIKPVIWLSGYVTTLMVVKVGIIGLPAPGVQVLSVLTCSPPAPRSVTTAPTVSWGDAAHSR